MPLVISDSSTLIHLSAINRLGLLRDFYAEISVPTAVWQEVVVEGEERHGVAEVQRACDDGWIGVEQVTDRHLLQLLRRDLHQGEAEVIALAVDKQADLVLLDESEARLTAEIYGLPKTGVVGILLRAKVEGKVITLQQELDALRQLGGFWIDDQLYYRALQAVGE